MKTSRNRASRADIASALRAEVAGAPPPRGLIERVAAVAASARVSSPPAPHGRRGAVVAAALGALLVGGIGASYATGVVHPPWEPSSRVPTEAPTEAPSIAPSPADLVPEPTDESSTATPDAVPEPGDAANPGGQTPPSHPLDKLRGFEKHFPPPNGNGNVPPRGNDGEQGPPDNGGTGGPGNRNERADGKARGHGHRHGHGHGRAGESGQAKGHAKR